MNFSEPIAIVGIGGVFPDANNPDQFWNNIIKAESASKEVPKGRWPLSPDDAYHPEKGTKDKVYSTKGCFIDSENFTLDLSGLDIKEQFVAQLDPLFHLLLYAGKEAFRDAKTDMPDKSKVGVILGNIVLPSESASAIAMEYLGRSIEEMITGTSANRYSTVAPVNRFEAGLPAGVLAKALLLGGGSVTLDAACSSSLYALSLGAIELSTGKKDAMLAGGISRPDCFYTQMGFSQLHALSATGVSAPFDKKGDGLVVGEGAGVFLLKRLSDAIKNDDHIYALIKGIGLSNDREGTLLAPSQEGQLRAMRNAYSSSGWCPSSVDLIECHAAGTPLGDAVEFGSLSALWKELEWEQGQCVIGSVKSNIGHLLTAAGSAGVMKVLLALKNEQFPPTANFTTPAQKIGLSTSPFTILSKAQPWIRRGKDVPRRAAVSAFGFGGINAHILIEEWIPKKEITTISFPEKTEPLDIAIVGMSADLEEDNKNISTFSPRWFGVEQRDWFKKEWGKVFPQKGFPQKGFCKEKVTVPIDKFRIPPKELEEMLPQQLLILKVSEQAIKDAGLTSNDNLETGVFIGLGLDLNTTNFHVRWLMTKKIAQWAKKLGLNLTDDELTQWTEEIKDAISHPLTPGRTLGALGSIAASRIVREFRCGGPGFTLSSEETSGVKALETACTLLQQGIIKNAVVGAVDFSSDIRTTMETHKVRPLPMIMADGAVSFVLKPLQKAREDKNKIYAIIKGMGSASGGDLERQLPYKETYTLALKRGYENAAIDPSTIDLVEVHGSGNKDEEERETQALSDFFNKPRKERKTVRCSNVDIGHTGAASALFSVFRAATSLYQEKLPGLDKLNTYWFRNAHQGPRRAGISSFSMDGNCTHLVLEGAESSHSSSAPPSLPKEVFILCGNNEEELNNSISQLLQMTTEHSISSINRCARKWWQENRTARQTKKLIVSLLSLSIDHLREQLQNLLESDLCRYHHLDENIFFSPSPLGVKNRMAFVYPGSGNYYPKMGMAIATAFPGILKNQDRENSFLKDQYAPSIFWKNSIDDNPKAALLGQVAIGTLGTDLLQQFDIRPHAAIGYSLGETTSLFSLKAWKERDEMLRRINESSLFDTDLASPFNAAKKSWGVPLHTTVSWEVGVINAPVNKVKKIISRYSHVYLLIINTPFECVIGGEKDEIEKVVSELASPFFPLKGITIAHCNIVNQVKTAYRNLHLFKTETLPDLTFYSGASGTSYQLSTENAADSILAHATGTVDFPRLINRSWQDGVRVFLEIGPGASCTRMIKEILGEKDFLAIPLLTTGNQEMNNLMSMLAQLLAHHLPVNLDFIYNDTESKETLIPSQRRQTIDVSSGKKEIAIPTPVSSPQENKKQLSVDADITLTGYSDLIESCANLSKERTEAHEKYLHFSNKMTETMSNSLDFHLSLVKKTHSAAPSLKNRTVFLKKTEKVFMDRAACIEFATGKIARCLGPEYKEIDSYPTRVRLPDEPLMLVDRILSVEGEPRSLSSGKVVTEHDVKPDAWYLDCGRIPTCIAVEAGQADLFLSGYLGIDFKTKGLAVYRLLDAVVTFYQELPSANTTIHYDIRIDRFFKQGNTYLFHFNFDATVEGKQFMSMRDGCAGFFTEQEIAAGRGIIRSKIDEQMTVGKKPDDWKTLLPVTVESYSVEQVEALRQGNLSACFGTLFDNLPIKNPLTIPGERMRLVDRVTLLNPDNGRYGLGVIKAEADISPDDWFLTCHFIDDQVMPGTLMYECCLHTLRIYLLRIGWVGEVDQVVYAPIQGIASRLKCRGQVINSTNIAGYEIHIKEIGYRPEPYVIVDALMYADNKPIVEISDMSLHLSGLTKDSLEKLWSQKKENSPKKQYPLYTRETILAFSTGNPSEAFGDQYKIFDTDRIIARLPRPPYQFLDRIIEVKGKPWEMVSGGEAVAEYDVPCKEWYFKGSKNPVIPFAILLEIALQPCGWLAAYIGSALTSSVDLHFRNLGGEAIQYTPVTPDSGTLTTTISITNVSSSAGMVIQHYDFSVFSHSTLLYKGNTYFGFFTKDVLKDQVGIRGAALYTVSDDEKTRSRTFSYPKQLPFSNDTLRMIDEIEIFIPEGGTHGKGFIQGVKQVKTEDWFFKAHFYQDPVCPGSLGLESFLQLLFVVAFNRWPDKVKNSKQTVVLNRKHRWIYRGQIIPEDEKVTVSAVITAIDDSNFSIMANGFLCVDGRVIYQMDDFGLAFQ